LDVEDRLQISTVEKGEMLTQSASNSSEKYQEIIQRTKQL